MRAKAKAVLQKGYRAIHDLQLLKVLQSEIREELSLKRFQNSQSGSLGDFEVEWDSPQSQDVVLMRKCTTGEDVAVSALLGPETFASEGIFPWEVLMKVCIRKPGLRSILQFDCRVCSNDEGSEFDIHSAYYLQSPTCLGHSVYKGPLFSTLDPHLQGALKEYLVTKGIGESLTNFLILHLHKKEQGQYVNWLQKIEAMATKDG